MRRSRQKGNKGGSGGGGHSSRPPSPQLQPQATQQKSPTARIFMRHGIDINTNLGEGFGHYKIEGEGDVLPYVTSANIACGAHAGDPSHMEEALEMVRYYGLSVGAHIGYPDIAGFGRRELHLSTAELRSSILYQLGALSGMAKTLGFDITQVRPHGYLYRQVSQDIRIATIVAKAIAEFDSWLILIGPSGSSLLAAGERAGIRVAPEAWIDRSYDASGNLLPHTHSRAVLKNRGEILKQAANLIRKGQVISADGTIVPIDFQTIHIHAKMADAKEVAEEIRQMIDHACSLTSEPFAMDFEDSANSEPAYT